MRTQPKNLVQKLHDQTKKFLEHAIGKAVSLGHSEVLVEHVLIAFIEHEDSDVFEIVKHFEINPFEFINQLERALLPLSDPSQKSSPNQKITLSESLLKLLEDAWLLSSVERNESTLRSGHLLLQIIRTPYRYLMEDLRSFSSIPEKSLFSELSSITKKSVEANRPQNEIFGDTSSSVQSASSSSTLDSFGQNFTEKARKQNIDPIFGRYHEIQQMIHILARRRKNNPILVGEPGVGKTALVEGLALAIVQKQVPEELQDVELIGLDLGLLQAGASVKGEFERRLKNVIQDVERSPRPIILFIDEAHMLMGTGGTQGTQDAANLLKPSLARGELRTIAATTWAEYKKYFEKDPALSRRFQPVKVDEPSVEHATSMLRGLRPLYEKSHGVVIRDESIEAAVELSNRFIIGRKLPDKAIDLIDTAAARVRVSWCSEPEVLALIEEKMSSYQRNLEALERDFEETKDDALLRPIEINKREIEHLQKNKKKLQHEWQIQKETLNDLLKKRQQVEKTTQNLELGTQSHQEQLLSQQTEQNGAAFSLLEEFNQVYGTWQKRFGKNPLAYPEVTKEVIAKTISDWTGIPVGKIEQETLETVLSLEDQLSEKIIGQPQALESISKHIRNAYSGIKKLESPVGVFLFVGTSGVGKTETARALADTLFGGEKFLTTINMTEFQEKHAVSRLIGSPPGYVGFGEGGLLTEAIRKNPHSVVLLDECEKAHIDVMNLFYQIFDRGMLTDGEGEQIDCKNTLFIMTSNLASQNIHALWNENPRITQEETVSKIERLLSQHFQPALLGRMTVIPFLPLDEQNLSQILLLKLLQIQKRAQKVHGVSLTFSHQLIQQIAQQSTFGHLGARNLEHSLERNLLPKLSTFLLEQTLKEQTRAEQSESSIEVTLDDFDQIIIQPLSSVQNSSANHDQAHP